jgi:erythromycin esterase
MDNHERSKVHTQVSAWLRQRALPLETIEAGHGFADLQPLKQTLQDVAVVGLGESTHGTSEFIVAKHRLLEFLVVELGFRLFALESSYPACEPINAYVLHGEGELEEVLSGQWYTPWDTEEFTAMVRWMRVYNASVPEAQQVSFYGVDINRNERGRQAVLAFLQAVAPERVGETSALFIVQAAEEAKWPLRIDDDARRTIAALLPQFGALLAYLRAHADAFTHLTSAAAVERAIQYTRVIEQWLLANAGDTLPPEVAKTANRSVFMAENFLWLMERQPPGTKAVIWLADGHICVESPWADGPHLGSILRERYGERYYALGLEFGGGSFLTRTALPDGRLGDFRVVTLPPAPDGSLPWYLSQVSSSMLLDLRQAAEDAAVRDWFDAPQLVYNSGWLPGDDETFRGKWRVGRMFDGIVFVNSTTPIRPTENALRAVAARERM